MEFNILGEQRCTKVQFAHTPEIDNMCDTYYQCMDELEDMLQRAIEKFGLSAIDMLNVEEILRHPPKLPK